MQKGAVLFPKLVLATLILPCLRKLVDKEKLLVTATKHQKQSLIYTKVSTFLFISFLSSHFFSNLPSNQFIVKSANLLFSLSQPCEVLDYWKSKATIWPQLCVMAKDVLAVPATLVGVTMLGLV